MGGFLALLIPHLLRDSTELIRNAEADVLPCESELARDFVNDLREKSKVEVDQGAVEKL